MQRLPPTMTTAQHFLELRLRLADCRASLRSAKDAFEIVTAQREQCAIDRGQANGKNAEERSRSLTIALATDTIYLQALSSCRIAEAECDRVEALLEAARDERRHSEWQIRARLTDTLLGTTIQSDDSDPAGDSTFDDTIDRRVLQRTTYDVTQAYARAQAEMDELYAR